MSVRWQHCINHADKQTKAVNGARLSSRRSSAADRQSVKRDYMLKHGFSPDPLFEGTMVNMSSSKRQLVCTTDNFRAIAHGSIVAKLFDAVILI